MKSIIIILFPILAFLSTLSSALADDIYIVVLRKQEEKKSSRWSLADWLITKKRIEVMDQWLALNSSSSVFEGYFDYNYSEYGKRDNLGSVATNTLDSGGAGLFASIVGIEGKYTKSNEKYVDYEVMASLRLFGRADQGSNITVSYGARYFDYNDEINNIDDNVSSRFWHFRSSLYLISNLGIQGSFRQYSTDQTDKRKIAVHGQRIEGGAFLDLSFLRLYGTYFKDYFYSESNINKEIREGVVGGVRLYW